MIPVPNCSIHAGHYDSCKQTICLDELIPEPHVQSNSATIVHKDIIQEVVPQDESVNSNLPCYPLSEDLKNCNKKDKAYIEEIASMAADKRQEELKRTEADNDAIKQEHESPSENWKTCNKKNKAGIEEICEHGD